MGDDLDTAYIYGPFASHYDCRRLNDCPLSLHRVEEWYDRSSVTQVANGSLRASSRRSRRGITADPARPHQDLEHLPLLANGSLHLQDDRRLFASLLESDAGSLVNLIHHYHEVLSQHGLGAEAEHLLRLAVQQEERAADSTVVPPPLAGMSVLLRYDVFTCSISSSPADTCSKYPPLCFMCSSGTASWRTSFL